MPQTDAKSGSLAVIERRANANAHPHTMPSNAVTREWAQRQPELKGTKPGAIRQGGCTEDSPH